MRRAPIRAPVREWCLYSDGRDLVWVAPDGQIIAWHWRRQWPAGTGEEGQC